jgi:hypothetical protein
MTHSKESLLIEPADVSLDGQLFETVVLELGAIPSVYQELYLSPELKSQLEQEFIDSGFLVNPDLTARHLDQEELAQREISLKQLKKRMYETEANPDILQAYRWRINEAIGGIHMLQASARGDMRSFDRWNRYIYGEPSPELFAATADWFCSRAELWVDDPVVIDEVATVLQALGPHRGNVEAIMPSNEVFKAVKEDHFKSDGYFTLLLAGVEVPDGIITRQEGDPVLRKVIDNLGADEYEIVDSPDTTWRINISDKQVQRPPKHRIPRNRYIGLPLGHEVGSHMLEALNGVRGPLGLMAAGLDRYELGNEGRAVVREQVAFDDFESFSKHVRWEDIIRRHLAVSLATGAAGEPMDFKSVYKVVNAVDTLQAHAKNPDQSIEEVRQKPHKRTWNLLTRTLKGTDGTGGAYLKDKVYLEGNVAWWTAAAENPSIINSGDLGKFDIANPRHVVLLQRLGILPEL